MTREENEARFAHRRQIAKQSFILMSACLVGLIVYAVTSDQAAQRVMNIQWLIGTASGLWSTLILGYYAAASYEQGRVGTSSSATNAAKGQG